RCRGGREHPGAALNPGALFAIPLVAASSHPLAPAALGAAEGALELFLAAMAKRSGTYTGARVADFQAVQIKVARARCLIDSARHLLRQSAIAFQDAAERNEVLDLDTKLRFARIPPLRSTRRGRRWRRCGPAMAPKTSIAAIRCSGI